MSRKHEILNAPTEPASLDTVLRLVEGRLSTDATISFDQSTASWIDEAYSGKIHSDLKPSNVYTIRYSGDTRISSVSAARVKYDQEDIINTENGNLIITASGVIEDKWDIIENIPAIIVDYNDEVVTMECLIDANTLRTQKRHFKKNLLNGAVEFKVGAQVLIKTYQRPGRLNIEFVNGKNLFRYDLFIDAAKREEAFAGIEKGLLDKPIKFPAKKK